MFTKVRPEEAGISSRNILRYLNNLEKQGIRMHSMILARGDKILFEGYWKPFEENRLHRMYSQTKSYVGIAVGELAAEGKISLDDKIIDYFPDKLPEEIHPYLEALTIRHMLKMNTCMKDKGWLDHGTEPDRLRYYFSQKPDRYPGTGYDYDSMGSFVLGCLVKRVTGKDVLSYMREKCLDRIGFSKEGRCLMVPGGELWSDSGFLIRPMDNLLFMRLLANGGKWEDEQLLHEENVKEATSNLTNPYVEGYYNCTQLGYGHQIWSFYDGSFGFYGMHEEMTIYHPGTDLLFVCTAGNSVDGARDFLVWDYFREIVEEAKEALPEDPEAYEELRNRQDNLALAVVKGAERSEREDAICGVTYRLEENPMGIKEFTLFFEEEGGRFCYINEQGEKTLYFGRRENVFQKFPQTGYSKEYGSMPCEGHRYDCAVSAAWIEQGKLSILVQVIDEYIGTLNVTIGFQDSYALLDMRKTAEAFLDEYTGRAVGVKK